MKLATEFTIKDEMDISFALRLSHFVFYKNKYSEFETFKIID